MENKNQISNNLQNISNYLSLLYGSLSELNKNIIDDSKQMIANNIVLKSLQSAMVDINFLIGYFMADKSTNNNTKCANLQINYSSVMV